MSIICPLTNVLPLVFTKWFPDSIPRVESNSFSSSESTIISNSPLESSSTSDKNFISPVSASLEDMRVLAGGIFLPEGSTVGFPKNFEIQIRPRSGLAAKHQISVLNTPGTIDADYRGELKVILINLGVKSFLIENGARIAQMVVCPIIKATLKEVKTLEITERGSGGFGSTGTK